MNTEKEPINNSGLDDLIHEIRFDHDSGHIWMSEARMLLLQASALGQLRRELIDILGWERAKGVMMRLGYAAGCEDAELVRRLRPHLNSRDSFIAGPQLHRLKGFVKVSPVKIDFDIASGEYYAEFEWHNSWEAEYHLADLGRSHEPVCWTLLGYASGYTSYYMGRQILFKETQCVASGSPHCINIGRPAEEWEDREDLERYLLPDTSDNELAVLRNQFRQLQTRVEQEDRDALLPFSAVGHSKAFKDACRMIGKAADSKVTILLLGETGVGKEIQARSIHRSSDRAEKPFVAVNCACIPPDLIEAELFGVERGAYTGATASREGKFERAHGGTIFLDEVIELPPRAQAALLRVLQEGELERIGDTITRTVDVRVVAATNEDLQQAVADGRFRADLFFRLNVFPVQIPPLRQRTEDIPLLIQHFLQRYEREYQKRTKGVTDKALRMLMDYSWPGNVRELENMVERGVILTEHNSAIEIEHFFPSLTEPSHPVNVLNSMGRIESTTATAKVGADDIARQILDQGISLDELEKKLIKSALKRSKGVVTEAAGLLGLTRPALAYRMKKITSPD